MPSSSGYFVGEDRDPVKKSVSFFCIEHRQGDVLWNRREVSEQWWVSLNSIHGSTVFLHEYATPDMPDQKKIFALDIETGDLRWSNDELRFLFAHDTSVYASKDGFDQRQFYEMDIASGKIVNEVDAATLGSFRERMASETVQLDFPHMTDISSIQSEILTHAIRKIALISDRIEFMEHIDMPDVDVVSLYESADANPASQSFRQHFIIAGKENADVQYQDILAEDVKTPVPDTFFSWNDMIYYIKEKKTLCAINLTMTEHRK